MFTRTNKLKTVFKEAYEGHALDIGITENNIYVIRGHIFMLICPAEQIDYDVLAEIVKLTGGLPKKAIALTLCTGSSWKRRRRQGRSEHTFTCGGQNTSRKVSR